MVQYYYTNYIIIYTYAQAASCVAAMAIILWRHIQPTTSIVIKNKVHTSPSENIGETSYDAIQLSIEAVLYYLLSIPV